MQTTPLWVPLAVAALGVLGTLVAGIAGVLLAQRAADRREERQRTWEAERERYARLFEHRRAAYASLIHQYHRWVALGIDVKRGLRPEPPEDAMEEFWRLVGEIGLYGTPAVQERAQDLFEVASQFVYRTASDDPSDDLEWEGASRLGKFMEAARIDLGMPPR